MFVCEINARFSVNSSVLKSVAVFSPTSPDFLCPERVNDLEKFYPTSGIDWIILDSQLRSAKSYVQSGEPTVSTIHEMRSHLIKLPNGFSEVIKVIDLVLTLPVTSVENERFFSCMKRVKTYLRSRCGDERLSDLLVIACLQEEAKNIDTELVIDSFGHMKQRRYPLF